MTHWQVCGLIIWKPYYDSVISIIMNKANTPTIYTVAKEAGVSITTVSRVLNSPHLVKDATLVKVLDTIHSLGFIPKAQAVARARQQTGRIGVLAPYFSTFAMMQRLRGISNRLADTKYELAIFSADSEKRFTGYLGMLSTSQQIDGLILISFNLTDEQALQLKENIPTVLIESQHRLISSVVIDNYSGGQMVANYLIRKGHQRMVFLDYGNLPVKSTVHAGKERLAGFKYELEKQGLELPAKHIHFPNWAVPTVNTDDIRNILSSTETPASLFVANDYLALITLHVARNLGYRIPEDIAIVGFDDIEIAEQIGLTTASQSLDDTGKLAVEMLMKEIHQENPVIQRAQIPLKLQVRETA
jgi:DNA-binding LacI/PurR family transcriptional regulator